MHRLALLLTILAGTARAATYHVSPGGSDANAGSAGAPWATLQHAADEVAAGDTVLVHDGTYRGFQIETSGTAGAPIVFLAAGDNVVVNDENPVRGDHHINVEGADYVVIEGFRVLDADVTGIRVVIARGVVVRDNVIGPNGRWGILTGFAPEVQIVDNITYGSVLEHGIYVSNSDVPDDNTVVRGNISYDNGRNGIQFNGDCWAGGDGTLDGGVIENNIVYDNTNKGLSIISAPGVLIRNNVIYENGHSGGAGGIHLVDEPGCGQPTDDAVVVNNTIVEPRIAGIRINDGASDNVVFNNLVVSGNPIADEEGLSDIGTNLTRSSTAGLFFDAPAHDYRLAADSDALDAGVASFMGHAAPGVDFAGASRPAGAAHDAGAYEGSATTPVEPAPDSGLALDLASNPIGASSQVRFTLPTDASVRLSVFDALGREIAVLVDEDRPAGEHMAVLRADDLPSGVYVAVLRADGSSVNRLMIRR